MAPLQQLFGKESKRDRDRDRDRGAASAQTECLWDYLAKCFGRHHVKGLTSSHLGFTPTHIPKTWMMAAIAWGWFTQEINPWLSFTFLHLDYVIISWETSHKIDLCSPHMHTEGCVISADLSGTENMLFLPQGVYRAIGYLGWKSAPSRLAFAAESLMTDWITEGTTRTTNPQKSNKKTLIKTKCQVFWLMLIQLEPR